MSRGPPTFNGPPPSRPGSDIPGLDAQLQAVNNLDGKPLPSLMSINVDNPENGSEPRLPQALEQALAFKTERAMAIGVPNEESAVVEKAFDEPNRSEDTLNDDGSITENNKKEQAAKGKRRKKKKKKNRKELQEDNKDEEKVDEKDEQKDDVEIEYVQEILGIDDLDPLHKQFARIFEIFKLTEPDKGKDGKDQYVSLAEQRRLRKIIATEAEVDQDEDDEKKQEEGKQKLSKRKMKKLTRLSVAELKQLVSRPDVVEMHDVTARDPKLLVWLKSHRNTVPVPRHWCFKRKYLQGKRGIEKPPFDLPEFIKRTGIMEMRAALTEKEDSRTLKAKMREKVRPKLGKIDIDYQKLHDAFFKWQTKPKMTIHGDLYYEGKEFETKLKEKKPGDLSNDLRLALGMPVGHGAHKVPPPWLIAMQRYGPPPSYPNLKIPGLNAPIPDGCSFGYHAGGWGKPPVDEQGRPLYGDVFGTETQNQEGDGEEEEIDRTQWGELESESEGSDEEEEEDEAEEENVEGAPAGTIGAAAIDKNDSGLITPAEGLVTPSAIGNMAAGLETPDIIELRKKKIEADMEGSDTPALYQVLPERRMDRIGNAMMGSTHVYDVVAGQPGQTAAPRRPTTSTSNTVELTLDPSELDLDSDAMAARYEQQLRQQQNQLQKEDLSDMVAEHVTRQKTKRKRQVAQDSKQTKKYKEFKF